MSETSTDPETILVVDDEPQNIKVVGSTLRAMGYEVVPATSAADARRRIAARLPDLILLDVRMPEVDGVTFCRELANGLETRLIPVVFLSAADEANNVVEALEAGGVDYVTKPFNKAELVSRVRTHLSLKAARDEALQLVRQREELIGILAHDIKNPLAGLRLGAQMLGEMSEQLPGRAPELVATINDAAGNLQTFVDRFLDYFANQTTITELDINEVDVIHVVLEALARHVPAAKQKNIEVINEIPAEPLSAASCEVALGQVVDNLISNAIKFSEPGSKVWLTVAPAPDGGVEISVRDEGPGLTAADQANLYQRFARLSAKPTGGETSTGLGLSIVKRLVDLMDGTIACRSSAHDGATFTVTLRPAGAPDASA